MIPGEKGFLLLGSHLGIPERKPLTPAQLRILARRVRLTDRPEEDRELEAGDLVRLGYSHAMAAHIADLLSQEDVLEYYLAGARKKGCVPVTRISGDYPLLLRQRLGLDSPGCLWAKGDVSLLNTPAVSLVGSRELREENRRFAEALGRQAAVQGLTLVSGNARGADKAAQNACLEAGGRVISIVADELARHPDRENLLYVSEDGYDEAFSAVRAISRNRCIHALGRVAFVAQANYQKGGTWDGTVKNLKNGWSSVACFRDGSEAMAALADMGAWQIGMADLVDLGALAQQTESFFDR